MEDGPREGLCDAIQTKKNKKSRRTEKKGPRAQSGRGGESGLSVSEYV